MIYITGDSHTGAMMRAADIRWPGNRSERPFQIGPMGPGYRLTQPFFADEGDRMLITEKRIGSYCKALTGRTEILYGDEHLYGFSLRLYSVRICEHPMWRRFSPWWRERDNRHVALSRAVMEEISNDDFGVTFDFYSLMLEKGVPFFAIEAPPLQSRLPVLQKNCPPDMLIEIDRFHRDRLRNWLRERGVDIIAPPQETFDEAGFLKPEYNHPNEKDFRHANTEFGMMMLDRIHAYLSEKHRHRL